MREARDYQIAALDGGDAYGNGVFKEWESHVSTLLNLPTGGGKTLCAAEVIKRQLGRTMFIVHLSKIVKQAAKELRQATGLQVAIEMAQRKAKTLDPETIIAASVQSLCSRDRLEKFDPFEFTLLICDEAHHSLSPSWQKVIAWFKRNPNLKVLHLTATPERGDKKKLTHFESIAYSRTLKDLIDLGWLVRPLQRMIEVAGLDLSKVRKMGMDLNKKDLEEAMAKVAVLCAHRSLEAIFGLYPHELEMIPEEKWREYIGDRRPRRTLAFCVGVLHAKMVAAALNSIYPGLCGFVDGKTEETDRIAIYERFENGDLYCLSNCGVTLEGYDNPNIEVILMLRPTRSRPLFLQAIGRGTRALKGVLDGLKTKEERLAAIAASPKKNIEIVDFTGNSGKLRLISLIDIFGEDKKPHVRRELEKRAKENPIDIEQEAEIIIEENRVLALQSTSFKEQEIDGFTGKKKGKKLTKEQKAERRERMDATPIVPGTGRWEVLVKQKLHPERRTPEENLRLYKQHVHRKIKHLCSFAQGFILAKFGYTKQELLVMKTWDASKAIDEIKNNGWKRPQKPGQSFTDGMVNDSPDNYPPAF
jgi:superfamily II DNA or RNA helicase